MYAVIGVTPLGNYLRAAYVHICICVYRHERIEHKKKKIKKKSKRATPHKSHRMACMCIWMWFVLCLQNTTVSHLLGHFPSFILLYQRKTTRKTYRCSGKLDDLFVTDGKWCDGTWESNRGILLSWSIPEYKAAVVWELLIKGSLVWVDLSCCRCPYILWYCRIASIEPLPIICLSAYKE